MNATVYKQTLQVASEEPAIAAGFPSINRGYDSVFRHDRLSLGLVVPIEPYRDGPVPTMERHVERVQLAEHLGFKAVWLRDVPFNVPAFGNALSNAVRWIEERWSD